MTQSRSRQKKAGQAAHLGGGCNAGEEVPIRSDRWGIQGSKDVRPAGQACGLRQFRFLQRDSGEDSPPECENGGPDPAKTKPELMKYLRDSFAYADQVMATIDTTNALAPVSGRYGGPSTKLGIAVLAVWHASDHYGQMVEYLRMNGIVPPASRETQRPSAR